MDLKLMLIGAAAASALAAAPAYAQLGQAASPGDAATPPNMSTPPAPDSASTGIPSADSTKLTGQDAGATNLPGGEVNAGGTSRTDGTVAVTDTVPAGPPAAMAMPAAPSAGSYGASASVTTSTVTNGPVPDTAENRAKYGQPLSRAGRRTAARGN